MSYAFMLHQQVRPRRAGSLQRRRRLAPVDRGNPIERLWGLMHKNVTHNRCHATYNGFCRSVLEFLRDDAPGKLNTFCDIITDNFRVISPGDFRICQVSRVYFPNFTPRKWMPTSGRRGASQPRPNPRWRSRRFPRRSVMGHWWRRTTGSPAPQEHRSAGPAKLRHR